MRTETELLNTTDAQVWAQEFMERFGENLRDEPACVIDEGLMIGWFANAIETGRIAGWAAASAAEAEIASEAPPEDDALQLSINDYFAAVGRGLSKWGERLAGIFEAKAVEINEALDAEEGRGHDGLPNDGLLTPEEHRLLDLTAQVANQFQVVLHASEEEGYTGNSAVRADDWNEVAVEIHHLQHRVMAQAAARAYPDRYRRLGATIPR